MGAADIAVDTLLGGPTWRQGQGTGRPQQEEQSLAAEILEEIHPKMEEGAPSSWGLRLAGRGPQRGGKPYLLRGGRIGGLASLSGDHVRGRSGSPKGGRAQDPGPVAPRLLSWEGIARRRDSPYPFGVVHREDPIEENLLSSPIAGDGTGHILSPGSNTPCGEVHGSRGPSAPGTLPLLRPSRGP